MNNSIVIKIRMVVTWFSHVGKEEEWGHTYNWKWT